MPRPSKPFKLPPLTGGCNDSLNVLSLKSDEANLIKNFHIDRDGIANSRLGSALINSSALGGNITSIYDYRRPSGSATASILLVTSSNKKLYSCNVTTGAMTELASLSSADRPSWCTSMSGGISYAIMANGTDFIKYDGTDVTNVDPTLDYPWTSGAPRYVYEYDNRVMASGVDSDPYFIYISDLLDCTEWKPSGSSIYWRVKGASGDRVTGLFSVYNYGVIFQQNSTNIITEADANSSTSEQITVSNEYGTTSHWSVQSIGNNLYFADESHIYIGKLRAAVENGMEVEPIDKNIYNKYKGVLNTTSIVSAYDPEHEEIQWGIRPADQLSVNTTIVYNLGLSDPSIGKYVWSGWFTGDDYFPYTLASVITSAGIVKVYRGDTNGYVYEMERASQYKDNETDVVFQIKTGALVPMGLTMNKFAKYFTPYLYQRYDASTVLNWIIDGRSTATYTYLSNLIPYWNDGVSNPLYNALWAGTVWNNKPVLPRQVRINKSFNHLQLSIDNAGTNANEELSYGGGELYYQPRTMKKVV